MHVAALVGLAHFDEHLTMAPFTVHRLAGPLGATVSGVDLSKELDTDTLAALRDAFVKHQVLVFRDQDLSTEDHLAFGRRFGELDTHPFVHGNAKYPEVIDVVTEADDTVNFGGGWHTDVTFLAEPDLGSILYAVELPPYGGDTLFASQRAAYDALTPTMQQLLNGLRAYHSPAGQYSPGGRSTQSRSIATKESSVAADTIVDHPVVRTHPETGDRSLYVNGAFTTKIVGMSRGESDALLGFLLRHAVNERFTCRVSWEPGTLVMWDNRSVQHYALHDYAGHRRVMRRITVKGDRPQ
jgi:taurine dioxygenase